MSRHRAGKQIQYRRLAPKFLEAHPQCEVKPCEEMATQVHHKKGRGPYLLATETWMAVCAVHHRFIHDNPKWAMEMGYLLTRA